ncbi:MAG: hypothetical protein Q8Q51_11255 [Lutibacter sp.]|nr:hypothetical protein [Lutibacter sp.]
MKNCPLCFIEKETLSFEHIPPQSLGNKTRVLVSNQNTFNPDSDFFNRRKSYNKGFGYQSLCEECNKHLGSKYVPSFTKFIEELKKVSSGIQTEYKITTKPLNVIKSIYSNAVVINHSNPNIPENFRSYILKKELSHQFLNYRVFIANSKNTIYRCEGWRIELDIPAKPIEIIASIEFPGIKIVIINSPVVTVKYGMEITNFNNSVYNEESELNIKYSR